MLQCKKLEFNHLICLTAQPFSLLNYESRHSNVTCRTSNTLMRLHWRLTLYDFECLCFHCTRTSWATTRVTMRMSTISACIASWPLCLACIRACSSLWNEKTTQRILWGQKTLFVSIQKGQVHHSYYWTMRTLIQYNTIHKHPTMLMQTGQSGSSVILNTQKV